MTLPFRDWKWVFIILFLPVCQMVRSQPVVTSYLCEETDSSGKVDVRWSCLGPEGQPFGTGMHIGNGQMNGLRFDPRYHAVPADSQGYGRIYAFSPTGGLWRTEDEGLRWEVIASVDRQLPAINVADLAVNQKRPSTLFLATGDGDHSYRLVFEPYRGVVVNTVFSSGVYRSVDDGHSWERIALPGTFTCSEPLGMQLVRLESHPDKPEILFALSPRHGLWRTRNALAPASEVLWEQVLNEPVPFEAESGWRGLAFMPGNPSTLYASGRRIYRSRDGGETWAPMPGFDPDSLFQQPYDDGFCSKAKINCPEVFDSLCSDMESIARQFKIRVVNLAVSLASPNRLYAYILAEEVFRKTVLSSGRGPERCRDFGTLETRPVLQIRMWDGQSWHILTERAERGMAASRMALAVSPLDGNEVVYGVVNLSGTDPGIGDEELLAGNAFRVLAGSWQKGFHVDVHALAFEPATSQPRLLIAHDGGLSWRTSGSQFGFCNEGLQTNLIWTFDHFERPCSEIHAVIGTQDCGTMILRKDSLTGQFLWESIGGGDGYGAQIDDRSGRVFLHENYSISQYDPFTGRKIKEVSSKFNGDRTLKDLRPFDPVTGDKAWVPNTFRILNHPETGAMIWGMTELYERTVLAISGVDDPVPNLAEVWKPLTDAGKRLPEQWKRRIWEFDICQSSPDVLYFAWSGLPEYDLPAAVFRTVPGGCDNETIYASELGCVEEIPMEGFPHEGPLGIDFPILTGIAAHPDNPDKVWVTFAGYQPGYKVWSWTRTPNGKGGIWTDEASGSLNNLPVNGIVCQGGTEERLYIATDAGVYYKEKGMRGWRQYGDLPNVRCTELKIHHCSGKLRVSTFGRGLWEADLLPLNELPELVINNRQIWSAPKSLSANLRIADGGTLVLQSSLGMPRGGYLHIDPGGTLTIEGEGEVKNFCGEPWNGINLVKNRTFWQWLLGKKSTFMVEEKKD